MTLKKDRSFTFAIDYLDMDETQWQLQGATALARQQREIIIPEVDKYVYGVMCNNAGTKPVAVALTAENIYDEIIKSTSALDNAEVPDDGNRCLVVTPDILLLMKKNPTIAYSLSLDKLYLQCTNDHRTNILRALLLHCISFRNISISYMC